MHVSLLRVQGFPWGVDLPALEACDALFYRLKRLVLG